VYPVHQFLRRAGLKILPRISTHANTGDDEGRAIPAYVHFESNAGYLKERGLWSIDFDIANAS